MQVNVAKAIEKCDELGYVLSCLKYELDKEKYDGQELNESVWSIIQDIEFALGVVSDTAIKLEKHASRGL